ncbi:hypothetical protein N7450_003636 [Penicillium hetheringtonii]|uniref:Uncharacterized protein n=1 Tax=Penicillium hetheringtonii TaxID=911720 RepID=A0AAD6GVL6_9EURO|nr:hypothetical protein N7450_003636 [Penicillium hetheringtonii]
MEHSATPEFSASLVIKNQYITNTDQMIDILSSLWQDSESSEDFRERFSRAIEIQDCKAQDLAAINKYQKKAASHDNLIAAKLQIDDDGFCCAQGLGHDLDLPALTAAFAITSARPYAVESTTNETTDTEMENIDQADVEIEDAETSSHNSSRISDPTSDAFPHSASDASASVCGYYFPVSKMNKLAMPTSHPTHQDQQIALRQLDRELFYLPDGISPTTICFNHAQRLFAMLDMHATKKSYQQLTDRLVDIYQHLGNWDTYHKEHARWFSGEKPLHPDNVSTVLSSVGVAHLDQSIFAHQAKQVLSLIANFEEYSQWLSVESLFRCIYHGEYMQSYMPTTNLCAEIQQNGSIVVPGLFVWLAENWDGQHPNGLVDKIEQEFALYKYHYREVDNHSCIGWQRNMWHSLVQQLIRQDLDYYMLYNTKAGEQTFFRHIDINVANYMDTGRGGNLLQGSVALKDEDTDNCTELLLGMHDPNKLREWWDSIPNRSSGFIHAIRSEWWNNSHIYKFNTDWTKQICAAFDVCLSSPLLPYRSTGPATKQRINVLPWFAALQDDRNTLDIPEGGTFEDLSKAHRDLSPAPKTPSGLTSAKHGKGPSAFPAASKLHLDNHISACLVGAEQWHARRVAKELDILFGRDEQAADDFITVWRNKVRAQYIQKFEEQEEIERELYGPQSFFY